MTKGDPEAAGIVQGAIEDFSQELALVIRRYLKTKGWKDTERIVVGGGFRASRVGELVIGRTSVILKAEKIAIELVPIRNDPDEAGLIGAVHLAPKWLFKGSRRHPGGRYRRHQHPRRRGRAQCEKGSPTCRRPASGSSICGVMATRRRSTAKAQSRSSSGMLEDLIGKAKKEDIKLAPFIGIGCPGIITKDGAIDRGAQNLPGNWESSKFHLPGAIHEAIPKIGGDETAIIMHNDAVVQGLSEAPFMKDVERWGVLTIGTGLGNARFTNRKDD